MANKTIKNVLEVSVNGMTAKEAVKKVQVKMDTVQKSALNIAVLAAYATGETIPAFGDFGEAVIEKKMSRKDFYNAVGRSHSTISRWLGALELILKAGDFAEFASGLYPFNYDKIFLIYSEKTAGYFKDYDKSDLFKMSLSSLKALITDDEPEDEDEDELVDNPEDTASEDEFITTSAEDKLVTFVYDGEQYKVKESLMNEFLKACEIVNA